MREVGKYGGGRSLSINQIIVTELFIDRQSR